MAYMRRNSKAKVYPFLLFRALSLSLVQSLGTLLLVPTPDI